VEREKLKELLGDFTKEELVFMFASMISLVVDKEKHEEMILKAHQLLNKVRD
jgi:hypothetical protein